MKSKGLASPTSKKDDIVDITRKAFGKLGATPRTLKQQLDSLAENELEVVLQTAHMVKLSSVFHKESEPYKKIVDSMYPNMRAHYRALVADILEDAESRGSEDTVDQPVNDIDFSKRRSTDEEKAEELQSAILQSLEIKKD